MSELVTTEELAQLMRYSSPNSAFREWLVYMAITPLPGRRGVYDMALVRRRLEECQGLVMPPAANVVPDLVQQRRMRRASGKA